MSEEALYGDLDFPAAPADRPYLYINMVSTIDGKTVTGDRDEAVMDLGSKLDHLTMRNIERHSDAVMIGAGTLRSTPKLTYGPDLVRVVVTLSGGLDYNARFFTEAPKKAFVSVSERVALPDWVQRLPSNIEHALKALRQEHGVQRLLIEGGSELNAELLRRDLVDELFLTLAPKVKLGRDVPTYAGGEPLSRSEVQRYTLLEARPVGDEVYLRYRRKF